MKFTLFSVFIFLSSYLFSQTIEKTLQEIVTLSNLITAKETLYKENLKTLRNSNSEYASKDAFETEEEYYNRMNKVAPILRANESLNKLDQEIKKLKTSLRELRGKTFVTHDIYLGLDKSQYNVEKEVWTVTLQHLNYEQELISLNVDVPRDNAKILYERLKSITKNGNLVIDLNNRVQLSDVHIYEDSSEFDLKWNFYPNLSPRIIQGVANNTQFSPDGESLLFDTGNRPVILSLSTGNLDWNSLIGFNCGRYSMCFNRELLAIEMKEPQYKVAIIDTKIHEIIHVFEGDHSNPVFISEDKLATLSKDFLSIEIYDIPSFALHKTINLPEVTSYFKGLSLLKSEILCVSTHNDQNISLIDITSGKLIKNINIGDSGLDLISKPNDKYFAIRRNNEVYIFDINSLENVYKFSEFSNSITFSPEEFMAVLSSEGRFKFYDLNTKKQILEFEHPRERNVQNLASEWMLFSPDYKYILLEYSHFPTTMMYLNPFSHSE